MGGGLKQASLSVSDSSSWWYGYVGLYLDMPTISYMLSTNCSAPAVWNSLPRTVLDCVTLSTLKSKLKTFLFSHTFTYTTNLLWPAASLALLKLRPKALYKNVIIIIIKSQMQEPHVRCGLSIPALQQIVWVYFVVILTDKFACINWAVNWTRTTKLAFLDCVVCLVY